MDISILKTIIAQQFGASITMLENAIKACPDKEWNTESHYWYTAYHTLFFLDYYLSEKPDDFMPPAPFTLSEFDVKGTMPERVYSQKELLDYLQWGRQKCATLITGLTEAKALNRFKNSRRDYSVIEILLYNMRHVQHHTAQLNILLRQQNCQVPNWVSRAALPE